MQNRGRALGQSVPELGFWNLILLSFMYCHFLEIQCTLILTLFSCPWTSVTGWDQCLITRVAEERKKKKEEKTKTTTPCLIYMESHTWQPCSRTFWKDLEYSRWLRVLPEKRPKASQTEKSLWDWTNVTGRDTTYVFVQGAPRQERGLLTFPWT